MRTFTTIIWASVVAGVTMTGEVSGAQESLIPADMVYVGHGPSVMGIDRRQPADSGKKLTPYERRMKTPWSAEAFHDEGPAHMVFLDSYLIDKYEVSNKDYGDFMRTANHPAPAYWDDPRVNEPEQPVVGVNWYDAKAYCEYRGKRLPTEAEWEKAARGPYGNLYPWGNELDSRKANYGKDHDATMPVDSYPEGVSYYGVYHMAGNVFEWVSDWYDPHYYGRLETMVNPSGPAKPIWLGGTGTYVDRLTVGEKRVIRGGSWIAPEGAIRATHRFWNHPLNNSYGVGLGFRCAKAAPPEIDRRTKDAYVSALVEMGRERFMEARQAVEQGLALDPKNVELLELRPLIERSMKTSAISFPAILTASPVLAGPVNPARHPYPEQASAVHEAEHDVDHAWEVYHRAALGGTVASPALQADIEQHLHEARTLVTEAQEAAERGETRQVDRLVAEIKIHTSQAIEESKEQKK